MHVTSVPMASPQQPSRPGPQPEADHPGTEGAVPEALCHNCATSDEVVDVPLTVSVIVAGTMADWARAQSPGTVEEILDRENKRMADSLASKVTRLKSLALDIDRDTEDQNRYLDGMVPWSCSQPRPCAPAVAQLSAQLVLSLTTRLSMVTRPHSSCLGGVSIWQP
ncbi:BET1-like protein [Manis javanica]|nr:BET1-like protein [Manis javanica]